MGTMDSSCLSLAPDTLAAIDQNDGKSKLILFNWLTYCSVSALHLIDLTSNRQTTTLPPIHHGQDILQVALSQTGGHESRLVAFVDRNRDVYLSAIRTRDNRRPGKLGTMVSSISWGTEASLLAGLRDSILSVWCCPQALYFDNHLLRRTTFSKDIRFVKKKCDF